MAIINPNHAGSTGFFRTLGGFPMLLCVGLTVVVLGARLFDALQTNTSAKAILTTMMVLGGAVAGALWAVHHARKIDPLFRDRNFTKQVNDALDGFDDKKNVFLALVAGLTCAYLFGFLVALEKFPASNANAWPLPLHVALVTAGTIGLQMYFAVRYASFVRMLVALDAVLSDIEDAAAKLPTLRWLRRSLFRDEQLYEPSGNIFVTMGITATFLGLAVGLATMDLAAVAKSKDLSSVSSFIGCMGLALGISMLGVLSAMSAQWFRGHGPTLSTDLLLERALCAIESAPASQAAP